jgi:hypothetical protein
VGARGVLFALTDKQVRALRAAKGDDDAVMEAIEEIEEAWDDDNLVETDKAWDAIHRALTDGLLEWANGSTPLNQVILGGEQLYEGDEYIVSLKTAEQVAAIAAALATVGPDEMGQRYRTIVPTDYDPSYGDEDREYTVSNYEDVRSFYAQAAASGRAVIFTSDP